MPEKEYIKYVKYQAGIIVIIIVAMCFYLKSCHSTNTVIEPANPVTTITVVHDTIWQKDTIYSDTGKPTLVNLKQQEEPVITDADELLSLVNRSSEFTSQTGDSSIDISIHIYNSLCNTDSVRVTWKHKGPLYIKEKTEIETIYQSVPPAALRQWIVMGQLTAGEESGYAVGVGTIKKRTLIGALYDPKQKAVSITVGYRIVN